MARGPGSSTWCGFFWRAAPSAIRAIARARGIDAYMAMAVEPITAMIKRREMSRAYRPTDHLRQQLAALTAQHAAVRELLAQ